MRRRIVVLGLLSFALLAPAAEAQGPGTEAVYGLVNDCYGLRAADGGKFVAKDPAGGYAATADVVGGAEPFRMQATTLAQYMLFGKAGDFLATGQGDEVQVVGTPGPASDWKVAADGGAFRLTSAATGKQLAVGAGGKLVTAAQGTAFTFEQAEGCATFPEAEINMRGEPSKGTTPFGEVRGSVDAHMHMMAFEFLGGLAHCGKPWSPYGITDALRDCPDHYPGRGAGAVLENAVSAKDEPLTHDPTGWPDFKGWPTWGSLTHEQSYYRWLERSWRGGQRIFVNLLVENKVLCNVYPLKKNNCDEMESMRLQARRIRELEAYVDAQNGGPGKGWFRIVTTPKEARRVINDGKLAVVLGIELSEPFGCQVYGDVPQCDEKDIREGLDEIYKLGVRDMELINKFDNALGGVAGDNGSTGVVVNNGNKLETGNYWAMETCKGPPDESDREQPTGIPIGHNHDDLTAAVLSTFASTGIAPVYGPGPHCNKRGLTGLGRFTVQQAMARGIMIDPDHLSVAARQELMPLIESKGYSGVVSSHSWSTIDTFPRIYKLGGFVAPYAGDSESFVKAWRKLKPMRDKRFFWGIGYGADMNGLGKQGHPRGADAPNKVTYPFKALDPNVTVEQNKTGTRTWDINTDGVAHYGLYPDWIEDLRKLAGDEIVEDLARGAESYLQMWERVEGARAGSCMPVRSRLTRRGLDDVQLGRTTDQMLVQAGQPVSRPGRVWSYCASLPGGKSATVNAVMTQAGRVQLVGSKAREHRASGIGVGDPASRLKRKGAKRAGRKDVMVLRQRGGNRFVYGVRKGKVRWTAVTTGKVAKNAAELRRALRLAGLR